MEVGAALALCALAMDIGGEGTDLPGRVDDAVGQDEMKFDPALVAMQYPAIETLLIRQAGV